MATRTTTVRPSGCTFCAHGHHASCRGDGCACSGRAHDPDVETAAAMRVFVRPDLRTLPVEELATQYRRQSARSVSSKGGER